MTRWFLREGRRWRLRSSSPVRFSEAVPVRSDRRDLRRRLRAASRAARAERKRQVTAGLLALSSGRVRIASVRQDVLGDELIEFSDGTRIWLEVRDGTTALRRLAAQSRCRNLYLHRVEPCFGRSWYQLGFSCAEGTGPTVLAKVKRYESKAAGVSWAASSRWHHTPREQRHG